MATYAFCENKCKHETDTLKVSSAEPTTNEKVWIQKGKNLFNKDNSLLNYYINSSGNIENTSGYSVSKFIKVQSEMAYTITFGNKEVSYIKSVNFYDIHMNFISNRYEQDNKISTTVITPTNCAFIRFCYMTDNQDIVQVEAGLTFTGYEEWIEEKVWVKNNNGVYVPFVLENKPINITTGVEFETGRIIDGKKEYGKKINISSFPNNVSISIDSGLRNVNYLNLEGMAGNGTNFFPINCTRPIDGTDEGSIGAYIASNEITIQCKSDRSSYSGHITVYYTKN